MHKTFFKSAVIAILLSAVGLFTHLYFQSSHSEAVKSKKHSYNYALADSESKLDNRGTKAARYEYFFRLTRDPRTNSIPGNIRNRELKHAQTLPSSDLVRSRTSNKKAQNKTNHYLWSSAGPTDVGGRTRALGIDTRNSNIVIAGGVSGGIWRSTDGGTTWDQRTQGFENTSVTSLVQDPINNDTWYYTTGEFTGNSASAPGAFYFGTGVYKSTDNGLTWNQLPSTSDDDNTFNSEYDAIERVIVNPVTGTVFIASNGFGVYRSTDGETFSNDPVVGTERNQLYCDVAAASDGTLIAVISEESFDAGSTANNPGVFKSTDDGVTWTEITPAGFPSSYGRSVVTFAPSNPNVAYIFMENLGSDRFIQTSFFFKVDVTSNTFEDRSENLPDFRDLNDDDAESGYLELQGGYNMIVSVKPDDPDFVIIGATNLFRSRDGFATKPAGGYDGSDESQKDEFWIGGYNKDNTFALYPEQHPDQHVVSYDPSNPNRMYAGHDGGIGVTGDVTATSVSWDNLDEGYIVTQFYTSAIPQSATDDRFMGGTQDNGTPFFRFTGGQNGSVTSSDISLGDGGFAYFTSNHFFVSQQFGRVIRYNKTANGDIDLPFAFVHPQDASNQLFIHPYVVDPNDETNMYYPSGRFILRNTRVDTVSNQEGGGTSTGWQQLNLARVSPGYIITALEMSSIPENILFFGGSSPPTSDNPLSPVLKRVDNASGSISVTDITIPNTPAGAYINDIAVNPTNPNELMVVMSNYNIDGLYHTTDGGQNWTLVEGNLTGTNASPGPSLRSATIIPSENGSIFILGTSTGVYSANVLDGSNTTWGQEAPNIIGFAVTPFLSSRLSNGDIAAGTHGRGMFKGEFLGETNAPSISVSPAEAKAGEEVTITATDFTFNSSESENRVLFNQEEARITEATTTQLKVIVPAGVIAKDADTNTATVTAFISNISLTTSINILPPEQFSLHQNYPNPFDLSTGTTIPIDIAQDSRVTLGIYNTAGRKVREPLHEEPFKAGSYTTPVDFSRLSSGIYIYRVIVEPTSGNGNSFIKSRKMTFIKSN